MEKCRDVGMNMEDVDKTMASAINIVSHILFFKEKMNSTKL